MAAFEASPLSIIPRQDRSAAPSVTAGLYCCASLYSSQHPFTFKSHIVKEKRRGRKVWVGFKVRRLLCGPYISIG